MTSPASYLVDRKSLITSRPSCSFSTMFAYKARTISRLVLHTDLNAVMVDRFSHTLLDWCRTLEHPDWILTLHGRILSHCRCHMLPLHASTNLESAQRPRNLQCSHDGHCNFAGYRLLRSAGSSVWVHWGGTYCHCVAGQRDVVCER